MALKETVDEGLFYRRVGARMLCAIAVPFALSVVLIGYLHGLNVVVADEDISLALGLNALIPILVGAGCFVLVRLRHAKLGLALHALGFEALSVLALFTLMYLHFQFKCWVPLLNAQNYDAELMATDRWLQPALDAIAWVRRGVIGAVPGAAHAYQLVNIFIVFFAAATLSIYCSRAYVRLLLALALCFSIGAYSYLIMPSVGPFLYVDGANPIATDAQARMLEAREALIAGGAAWANAKLGYMFTGPLAAMPSLHLAVATLLLMSSWSLPMLLRVLFVFNFSFMFMESVTAKWHYLIDLPVGIVFGAACFYGADWLLRRATVR